MHKGLSIIFSVAAALGYPVWAAQSQRVTLSNEHWAIEVSPYTLETTAHPAQKEPIQLSQGQSGLGRSGKVAQTGNLAKWELEDQHRC